MSLEEVRLIVVLGMEWTLYFLICQRMKARSTSLQIGCLILVLPLLAGLGVWVVSRSLVLGGFFTSPVIIWMRDVVLALYRKPGH
jgi:hypothetical protein